MFLFLYFDILSIFPTTIFTPFWYKPVATNWVQSYLRVTVPSLVLSVEWYDNLQWQMLLKVYVEVTYLS